jgi:hypothetical protein
MAGSILLAVKGAADHNPSGLTTFPRRQASPGLVPGMEHVIAGASAE